MYSKTLAMPPLSFLKVMSHNLMALEGAQITVAVVGSAHLDGMERILTANGWVESEIFFSSQPPTSKA